MADLGKEMRKELDRREVEEAPNWFGYNQLTDRGIVPVDPPSRPLPDNEPRYITNYKDQPFQGEVIHGEVGGYKGTDRGAAESTKLMEKLNEEAAINELNREVRNIRGMKTMPADDKAKLINRLRSKYQGVNFDWDAALKF